MKYLEDMIKTIAVFGLILGSLGGIHYMITFIYIFGRNKEHRREIKRYFEDV